MSDGNLFDYIQNKSFRITFFFLRKQYIPFLFILRLLAGYPPIRHSIAVGHVCEV